MDSKLMQYFQTAEEGLTKGFSVNLAIGPKLYSEEERRFLIDLMKEYPDIFAVTVLSRRPRHQMIQIGNDFELIVPHEINQEVVESIGLTEPHSDVAIGLKRNLASYDGCGKEATIEDIEKMKLYHQ